MDCQEIFNEILSSLEYDNIPYEMATEDGKIVVRVTGKDGIMKLTAEM